MTGNIVSDPAVGPPLNGGRPAGPWPDTVDAASGRVTHDDFRGLMGAFPTGVAVITAVDQAGQPHGLTCTSLTSVTLHPPTLLICLNVRSGTLAAARERGRFAVNLLHAYARRAAEVFSSAVPDRFAQVTWQPSVRIRQPWLIDDAFALAECVVVGVSVVEDHAVVLGEVVHVKRTCDVPLLYGMRQFSRWRPDLPDERRAG